MMRIVSVMKLSQIPHLTMLLNEDFGMQHTMEISFSMPNFGNITTHKLVLRMTR